jgi:hypothetical protein
MYGLDFNRKERDMWGRGELKCRKIVRPEMLYLERERELFFGHCSPLTPFLFCLPFSLLSFFLSLV